MLFIRVWIQDQNVSLISLHFDLGLHCPLLYCLFLIMNELFSLSCSRNVSLIPTEKKVIYSVIGSARVKYHDRESILKHSTKNDTRYLHLFTTMVLPFQTQNLHKNLILDPSQIQIHVDCSIMGNRVTEEKKE